MLRRRPGCLRTSGWFQKVGIQQLSHSTNRITPKPFEAKLARNFLTKKYQFIPSQTVATFPTQPTRQLWGNLTPVFRAEPRVLGCQFSTQGLLSHRAALEPGVSGAAGSGSGAGLHSTVLSVLPSCSRACGAAGNFFSLSLVCLL